MKKRYFTLLCCILLPVIYELLLRLFTIGSINFRFIYIILFSVPAGGFIFIFTMAFGKRANKIVFNVINGIMTAYFIAQLVYFVIFKAFFSISQVAMGGEAIMTFTDQTLHALFESAIPIAIYIAVFVTVIIFTKKEKLDFSKVDVKEVLKTSAAVLVTHLLCLSVLLIGGTGSYSIYDTYHSNDTKTKNSVPNLGVLVTTRLELQHLIFAPLYEDSPIDVTAKIDYPEYSPKEYNVSDVDFNEIVKKSNNDENVAALASILANREPTKKNEYTGFFEGKNLITICAESFSPYLIDEERTPALYRLSKGGLIFNNFYNSYDAVTTNGEYTFCMGNFPDLSRSKKDNSFIESADNALPYSLANQFNSVNAKTYAYHNFNATYYSRYLTHPNMGYKVFKTPDNGLDIAPTWPSSDYDMMLKSVDDYIYSGSRFHAYYMTFSGHYQYNWENYMDAKNKSLVKDIECSEAVQCYIAGNMELEFALQYLLERLEEAGIADDTVIVLTTDHYPYGLLDKEYEELASLSGHTEEIDKDFEMYRSSFICWSGDMEGEDAIEIDDYCSTIDILPTLLNLFGFEYDSRLIMGRDILSDSEPIAIISNDNFICEDYRFNATDNELVITNETVEVTEEEINLKKQYVKDVMTASTAILNTDFYKYLPQEE